MAPSRFDIIGRLTVTDEYGQTRTVDIRREDLTGTNGAYRAIRDTVVDALRDTLEANRGLAVHPECLRFGYIQDGRCCGHAD